MPEWNESFAERDGHCGGSANRESSETPWRSQVISTYQPQVWRISALRAAFRVRCFGRRWRSLPLRKKQTTTITPWARLFPNEEPPDRNLFRIATALQVGGITELQEASSGTWIISPYREKRCFRVE